MKNQRICAFGAKRYVVLLGTTSVLALALGSAALAQQAAAGEQAAAAQQVAGGDQVEQVLVTGSLIRGAAAVGVPVTDLSAQDIAETGSLTIADVLRDVPALVLYQPVGNSAGGNAERNEQIDIHGLDSHKGTRDLLLIDGIRVPLLGHDPKYVDPSVVPTIAFQRVDVLTDGASATYGSDAISGVVNVILRRGYDGAQTTASFGFYPGGGDRYQADQLWGRTWDGGDITLSYEWLDKKPLLGSAVPNYTGNFTPWGLDDQTPLGAATIAGVVSIGKPNSTIGTGCTNCYMVPLGQNGTSLTWAQLTANPGVKNEINPYNYSWYLPAVQTNAAVATFDQRLFPGVNLFADAVYSNRRLQIRQDFFATDKNADVTYAIPTTNPYYPVGAPAGLDWTGNLALQESPYQTTNETFGRYDFGLNIDLPSDWLGKVYVAETKNVARTTYKDQSVTQSRSAALGWNVSSTNSIYASYTKPADVPYLNLFCDPTAFTCNSPSTLSYIGTIKLQEADSWLTEEGMNLDGPLFTLPGGVVRAAIGATYDFYAVDAPTLTDQDGAPPPAATYSPVSVQSNWWASFVQLNIPLFGKDNAIPLIQRLDVEASVRHDQYSYAGGTNNEKVSLDWAPVDSLTLRGTWGTSFRAPQFLGEVTSPGLTGKVSNYNTAAGVSSNTIMVVCTNGKPTPGSAAAAVNPTCNPADLFPGGGSPQASAGESAYLRSGSTLQPEIGTNWGLGFDWTPTNFLQGLDAQVTYYKVHIAHAVTNLLASTSTFNDPRYAFLYTTAASVGAAKYATILNDYYSDPVNTYDPATKSNIQWIEDGGNLNLGYVIQDGIDYNVRYDWDMSDFGLGMWDAGIVGTYTFHSWQWSGIAGDPPIDTFHQTLGAGAVLANGVEVRPRYTYRTRLGWSDGGWSVSGFFNYSSHYFTNFSSPPASVLAKFPNYSNLAPEFHTFDLSIAHNTMDQPANVYLRNITVRLVVNNILDKHPAFQYSVGTDYFGNQNSPTAFDNTYSDAGRLLQISVTKDW